MRWSRGRSGTYGGGLLIVAVLIAAAIALWSYRTRLVRTKHSEIPHIELRASKERTIPGDDDCTATQVRSQTLSGPLAMMPMHTAHMGSNLTGIRRAHSADLGNVD